MVLICEPTWRNSRGIVSGFPNTSNNTTLAYSYIPFDTRQRGEIRDNPKIIIFLPININYELFSLSDIMNIS